MSLKYKTILKLRTRHSYYTNGYSNDLSFLPFPQTLKLIKRYKLIFKPVEFGFDLLQLVTEDDQPLIDLGNDQKLSFGIHLRNVQFLNFTQLRRKDKPTDIYYLGDTDNQVNIIRTKEWVSLPSKSPIFNYRRESEANAVTLNITDPFGAEVFNGNMIKSDNQFSHLFDLGNRPEGKYAFVATEGNVEQPKEEFFVSDNNGRNKAFAVLDIFSRDIPEDRRVSVQIRLAAKKAGWKYFVNLNRDYSGSSISIVDTRDTPEILFKKVNNSGLEQGGTLVFLSYQPDNPTKRLSIDLKEEPIKEINLIIEKNGDRTEIRGLPNPSVNLPSTDMHINI